ncbi:hypothetical protein [Glycomyces sp. NPDC021274]|uniref:hypothetical protein n=1 Tax=Glycomyces sp. NPDC021274 TaxID=3155120 RepID=UPI0033DF2E07
MACNSITASLDSNTLPVFSVESPKFRQHRTPGGPVSEPSKSNIIKGNARGVVQNSGTIRGKISIQANGNEMSTADRKAAEAIEAVRKALAEAKTAGELSDSQAASATAILDTAEPDAANGESRSRLAETFGHVKTIARGCTRVVDAVSGAIDVVKGLA